MESSAKDKSGESTEPSPPLRRRHKLPNLVSLVFGLLLDGFDEERHNKYLRFLWIANDSAAAGRIKVTRQKNAAEAVLV